MKTNATGAIIISIATINYTVCHLKHVKQTSSTSNIANLNKNMVPKKRVEPMHYLEIILIMEAGKKTEVISFNLQFKMTLFSHESSFLTHLLSIQQEVCVCVCVYVGGGGMKIYKPALLLPSSCSYRSGFVVIKSTQL